jgi:hypothetical protein
MLKRKTPLSARKPMQKRRRKPQKDARWRSDAYLTWVRQRPCAFCGQPAGDAHHVIGLGWGLSGMGLTAPDSYAMPLCRHHHAEVHQQPALQRLQPQWLRWTLRAALDARNAFDTETREALTHALAFVEAREEL